MKTYTQRIEELEAEGMTTSDAQGVLETEERIKQGKFKQWMKTQNGNITPDNYEAWSAGYNAGKEQN